MDTIKERSIDDEIKRLLTDMEGMDVSSKEYAAATKNLTELVSAENSKNRSKVSPDMIVSAVTNIAGILLILNYERLDIVTSKAINFVLRRS